MRVDMKWVSVVAIFAGCAGIKVVPAPLAADEQQKLQAALIGECWITELQPTGGAPKPVSGIGLQFWDNGVATTKVIGPPNPPYKYSVSGRNVTFSGYNPYAQNIRVDEYDERHLKFFIYDYDKTATCEKR